MGWLLVSPNFQLSVFIYRYNKFLSANTYKKNILLKLLTYCLLLYHFSSKKENKQCNFYNFLPNHRWNFFHLSFVTYVYICFRYPIYIPDYSSFQWIFFLKFRFLRISLQEYYYTSKRCTLILND